MFNRIAAIISVTLIALIGLSGCTSVNAAAIPPNIPPQYYNCTETDAYTLFQAYYSRYANISMASVQFDNQYYVFKNLKVTAELLKTI